MGETPTPYVVVFSPEPRVAYFLKGVLDSAGFAATATSLQPDDVLLAVERTRPDVIVFDVTRRVAGTWDSLERLRRWPLVRDIPVVIVTSDALAVDGDADICPAIELSGRPDDVTHVREAVRRAVETGSARPAA